MSSNWPIYKIDTDNKFVQKDTRPQSRWQSWKVYILNKGCWVLSALRQEEKRKTSGEVHECTDGGHWQSRVRSQLIRCGKRAAERRRFDLHCFYFSNLFYISMLRQETKMHQCQWAASIAVGCSCGATWPDVHMWNYAFCFEYFWWMSSCPREQEQRLFFDLNVNVHWSWRLLSDPLL